MTVALPHLFPDHTVPDVLVSGISLDSRQTQPGELFVALPGETSDGRWFIQDALDNGACAIVSPTPLDSIAPEVPLIVIPEIKSSLGRIAGIFYGMPSEQLRVAAVTGTNGKTSVTFLAANAMSYLSHQAGIIGTLGAGVIGELEATGLTTPDAVTFQASLSNLAKADVEVAFVEAS
ncbi:MAG: Mur ligase family protein, partial [Pseudomonadales bacterium]